MPTSEPTVTPSPEDDQPKGREEGNDAPEGAIPYGKKFDDIGEAGDRVTGVTSVGSADVGVYFSEFGDGQLDELRADPTTLGFVGQILEGKFTNVGVIKTLLSRMQEDVAPFRHGPIQIKWIELAPDVPGAGVACFEFFATTSAGDVRDEVLQALVLTFTGLQLSLDSNEVLTPGRLEKLHAVALELGAGCYNDPGQTDEQARELNLFLPPSGTVVIPLTLLDSQNVSISSPIQSRRSRANYSEGLVVSRWGSKNKNERGAWATLFFSPKVRINSMTGFSSKKGWSWALDRGESEATDYIEAIDDQDAARYVSFNLKREMLVIQNTSVFPIGITVAPSIHAVAL
ncbi:hypothetical protein OAO01_06045 [Oligoflexia bacterium]|nr:hypothetical protein [Oligoflexia bacterium]